VLPRADVRHFFEQGYLLVPGVFTPREVAQMRRAFERLEELARRFGQTGLYLGSHFVVDQGGDPPRVRIQRIVWCGAAEPLLDTYGEDPRLLGMAACLLGSRAMDHLINQAHFKLPGDEVAFPWHQDSTHRRFGHGEWRDVNGRGSYVQTIVAVDDATPHNGPMKLIPGSGSRGHISVARGEDVILSPEDERKAILATMTAGDVLLIGPYVVHGSDPNRSAAPRRSFINGFAYPGANSRRYPGRGAGRRVVLG